MLDTKFVGDKFETLVTDLIYWENLQHNEKSRQHNDFAINISVTIISLTINDSLS